MAMTVEQVREAIGELNEFERELLYIDILQDFESVDPEIEKAWIEEVKRRAADIESGKAEFIPGEQVMAEIRQMLNERRSDSISSSGQS
ncbi:MAG: addiction module protein [Leptospiraceae bacterium]|nr:addiction module protein [Leptospiraceae bacterium]